LSDIFFIRLELFKRKFSVKFLNNLLMQLLSVVYYVLGGYFVISGRLDLGALVASISAYKDLPTPVKGLIDWDQQRLMAQQRYIHAIEDFSRDDLIPAQLQDADATTGRLSNGFDLRNVAYQEEGVSTRLDNVSAQLALGETVAIVAEPPQNANVFLELCARLLSPIGGQILLDGNELKKTPEAITGRSIGYADSGLFLPGGTIEDCLLEVLKNRPVPERRGEGTTRDAAWLIEARASGNSEFDVNDDWIDRERINAPTDAALLDHILHVARIAGLQDDIHEIGLNSRMRAEDVERIAPVVGKARTLLRDKLSAAGLAGLVEQFHVARYNSQASVAENILFGMPVDPTFAPQALPANAMVRDLLRDAGLEAPLVSLGLEIARTFTDMFANLSSASPLFEQAAGMTPERIASLGQVVARVDASGLAGASKADIDELMTLSMAYVEPRSRFGLLDDALTAKILSARERLRAELSKSAEPKVVFNDYDTYNPSLTIADNILFGRIETNLVGGRTRIIAAVTEVLAELGLSDAAFRAGLAFDVGTGGRALSEAQRQKLRLARALMKKPDFLVLNRPCAALPAREQRAILEAVLADARERAGHRPGIVCAPADRSDVMLFDRVLFLEDGRLVEEGSPKVLLESRREFARLVEG
ncbi:ATP-binding cassette domain-containing protein, partial [Rhizobiaceae sp. 2RAB30]